MMEGVQDEHNNNPEERHSLQRDSEDRHRTEGSTVMGGSEILQNEEDIQEPNAFVEQDPRPIFAKLAEYSKAKDMMFEYRKNSKRIRLFIPIDQQQEKFIGFRVLFVKGRKKSMKGLWRLRFQMEKQILTKTTI